VKGREGLADHGLCCLYTQTRTGNSQLCLSPVLTPIVACDCTATCQAVLRPATARAVSKLSSCTVLVLQRWSHSISQRVSQQHGSRWYMLACNGPLLCYGRAPLSEHPVAPGQRISLACHGEACGVSESLEWLRQSCGMLSLANSVCKEEHQI
jgi:hypothetical protein